MLHIVRLRSAPWLALGALIGTVAAHPAGAGLPGPDTGCYGDCDGDGRVAVDELIKGVNIALGNRQVGDCLAFENGCGPGQVCINDLINAVNNALDGCPLPALIDSDPAPGAADVPRTAWLRLELDGVVASGSLRDFSLTCDGVRRQIGVSAIAGAAGEGAGAPAVVVVNPVGELPPAASCALTWPRAQRLEFATAEAGAPATVVYDRTSTRLTVPYPDDYWLVDDSSTATGVRVEFPVPDGPADLQTIFSALAEETNRLDGFSQIAPLVVELSDAPDPASLPLTATESLDPLATIGLFALDGPQPGLRIPFQLRVREDTSVMGVVSHTLLIFPSIPLSPRRHYGLVVTRRALVDPGRPLGPSPFFAAALAPARAGEAAPVARVRQLAGGVLDVAAAAVPPLLADDVALAVHISVRSVGDIPADLAVIKEQVLAAPPPAATITDVEADSSSDVAAIVHGTWEAPDWREGSNLKRDAAGRPVQTGTRPVPFTLALPAAALKHAVPITMYQHGNPGSSENEVPGQARRYLGAAGFAVIGFTDILNREVAPGIDDNDQSVAMQAAAVIIGILQNHQVPDFWVETHAEQIAFLRMLDGLDDVDVLPIGAPDGVPELDPAAPRTYVGISEGANNAQAFLPFAPEIRAAAAVVGGERLAEVLVHQQASLFIEQLGGVFPSLTPADIWVGVALFQGIFDRQDPHNKTQFLYRDPIEVGGTTRKPSILVVEGLNDSMVPNNATESFAWSMGPIPHLEPVQRAVPFLAPVAGPVRGNIDADTTSAFFQYVPLGVPGIDPTPGCTVLSPRSANEGHYCAQSAAESLDQRVVFFQSAVNGEVPVIVDPFAP